MEVRTGVLADASYRHAVIAIANISQLSMFQLMGYIVYDAASPIGVIPDNCLPRRHGWKVKHQALGYRRLLPYNVKNHNRLVKTI